MEGVNQGGTTEATRRHLVGRSWKSGLDFFPPARGAGEQNYDMTLALAANSHLSRGPLAIRHSPLATRHTSCLSRRLSFRTVAIQAGIQAETCRAENTGRTGVSFSEHAFRSGAASLA